MDDQLRTELSTHPSNKQYLNAVAKLEESRKIEVEFLQSISGGRTQAFVALAKVTSKADNTVCNAILKINQPDSSGGSEGDRLNEARSLSPNYAEKRIPGILYGPLSLGQATATLFEIAGDSLASFRPLESINDVSKLTNVFAQVSKELLGDWNTQSTLSKDRSHPSQILQSWLGYRIDTIKGHIASFLENECKFDFNNPWALFQNDLIPNPYAFARERSHWENLRSITAFKGLVHGDLNTRNLLVDFVKHTDTLQNYYLIDFANFTSSTYLLYDHAYLELSFLINQFKLIQSYDRFAQLSSYISDYTQERAHKKKSLPPELVGASNIFHETSKAFTKWRDSAGYGSLRDDLYFQYNLARVAVGLNFCNKVGLHQDERFAAFIYAAYCLKNYFDLCDPVLCPRLRSATSPISLTEEDRGNYWNEFFEACGHFDKTRIQILITGPDLHEYASEFRSLANVDWSVVIDFDSATENGGLYSETQKVFESRRALHLLTSTTTTTLDTIHPYKSTSWYAADGLDSMADSMPSGNNWRNWIETHASGLKRLLQKLVVSSGEAPITCVILWNSRRHVEHLCDLLIQNFSANRICLIFAPSKPTEDIKKACDQLEGRFVPISTRQIASGLQGFLETSLSSTTHIALPAALDTNRTQRTQVMLDQREANSLEEEMTLVHLSIERQPPLSDQSEGTFLKGRKIVWSELDRREDVKRTKYNEVSQRLREDLNNSTRALIRLSHRNGAGGTTLARRIAWDQHRLFPTVLLHHISSNTQDRLFRLYGKTQLPILVVVEDSDGITIDMVEKLHHETQSSNLTVIFLYVQRVSGYVEESSRQFFLQERLDRDEIYEFASEYKRSKPDKIEEIHRLAEYGPKEMQTAFGFGITAFGEDFRGLDNYIDARLKGLSEKERHMAVYLGLAYHYGHFTLPAQMYLQVSGQKDKSNTANLESELNPNLLSLLLKEQDNLNVWRPAHELIAFKILEKLMGNGTSSSNWRNNLSSWAIRFIDLCAEMKATDGPGQSERMLNLLKKIFIFRDNSLRDSTELMGNRPRIYANLYANLIEDILKLSVRPKELNESILLVFKALIRHWPQESHFLGHLGRYYSLCGEFDEALNYINSALHIDPEDRFLRHMKGKILYLKARTWMAEAKKRSQTQFDRVEIVEGLREIEDLQVEAADEFGIARELGPQDEHPYVDHIRFLADIVECAFQLSGEDYFENFIRNPQNIIYRQHIETAEALLESVRHLQADRSLSRAVLQSEERLDSAVQDYDQWLEDINLLMERDDVDPKPLRRQSVWVTYRRANRSWDKVKLNEHRHNLTLMEDNLLVEPENTDNIRLWFESARRLPNIDIDQAIEKITLWNNRAKSIDATYYLYVLNMIKAIDGSPGSKDKAQRFIKESQENTEKKNLRNGSFSFDFFGVGTGLTRLVHFSRLGDGRDDKDAEFWTNSHLLARVKGRINRIEERGAAGEIILDCGLRVHFAPRRRVGEQFSRDQDINKIVTCFIGFRYNGPTAWSVKRSR